MPVPWQRTGAHYLTAPLQIENIINVHLLDVAQELRIHEGRLDLFQ